MIVVLFLNRCIQIQVVPTLPVMLYEISPEVEPHHVYAYCAQQRKQNIQPFIWTRILPAQTS